MIWSGEWVQRHEPGAASSAAENHPRGRQALERGGGSPEGASGPRARRSLRGVAHGPRARRKLDRGVPRSFGWWAVVAFLGCGPFHFGLRPLGMCFRGSWHVRFVFYYFSKRWVSPVIRGPLWLSPTVAPEPLRWYT
jgi:hypothetical protein